MTKLTTLDLSYNSLSEWALLALGTLPQLKELHLTGMVVFAKDDFFIIIASLIMFFVYST